MIQRSEYLGRLWSCIATCLILCPVGNAATLTFSSACNGTGVSGTYADTAATVQFQSCPTSTVYYSKFWNSDGSPITELTYNRSTNTVTSYKIAGIAVTSANTESERTAMAGVLISAPAVLAQAVPGALENAGFSSSSDLILALAGNLVGYETGSAFNSSGVTGCTSPTTGCRGCCGAGCGGCYVFGSICTAACLEHDDCVAAHGHRECFGLLLSAAIPSYLSCIKNCNGIQCNCCGGQGPACDE